ncbi:hypothetical protein DICVIV_07309 [Dictyocaulus viviparus]|uniref:Uncharacterized protein n=1 Tax=Dictyocaulus viviparus TaxID=29172 RepID=A0A0D8XW65_DICVI|nr:hypothetical protein DICVIV_07309 [Dictyocaulus viviparus]
MNVLPLPKRSKIFGMRYLAMIQSYNQEFCHVDINRFVTSASTPETLELIYLLTDVECEISGSLWDKAANLLFTTCPHNPKLQAFVTNQLIVVIQARSPCSLARFKFVLDKLNCAQPDADFLFMFCNEFLSRLRGYFSHIASQLIPLWIFSVLAYSTSREMETKRFTSLIWNHISQMLGSIASTISMELSLGNLEFNVVKFFMVLGSSKSSADIIRKIVADSVPLYMVNQIVILLKNDDDDLQERILRVCGEILTHVGHTLLAIAETEAHRIGLNRTSFVVLIQALVAKLLRSSMDLRFYAHVVPIYVSALIKLPYRMFIYSRIKDILIKFVEEPTIMSRISDNLADLNDVGCYNQLVKETDPRIRRFFDVQGST